jgi:predicted  nucleic acid-binding Zn-ribbon protein
MHPDLEKLIVLQRLDLEAKRLRDEMTALPKHVAGLSAKLAALEGQRAVVVDLLAKEEALRRRQESDVKDFGGKIEKGRKKVDAATTSAMVEGFEREIAFAQGEIGKLEDAELESMLRTEEMEAQRTLADAAIVEAKATLSRERARAVATIDSDKLLLAGVEGERAVLRPTIGEAILSNYDRIAKGKGTGLAEALNQKCMACQMMLRPQKWNDIRNRDNEDEMMTCESCGRLLYYDPARDSPQRKVVEVESIAARIVRSL